MTNFLKTSPLAKGSCNRESRLRDQALHTLRQARLSAGLSLRELALRAGTSHATLSAYEQGRKTPSVTTFLRILDACGQAVDVELSPRIRAADGLPRGEELQQVLLLAEAFPASHSDTIEFPPFRRSA